jgi:hypothetical protein
MQKKFLVLLIASVLSSLAMAAPEDITKAESVDPFSGDELQLEKLNKELQLQKAIVANLREQLNQTTVSADIEIGKVKGALDQKKIKKDIERLDVSPIAAVSPHLIQPPQIVAATPIAEASAKNEQQVSPIVKVKPKKEPPKPDVVLGAIQFGNEKPSYLVEKPDGRYLTTSELDAKAIQAKNTGFYTTVKESDIYQPGSGDASNSFGRKGVQAPFGNSSAPTPGSIPITVPQLQSPSGNGMMPPQGLNHVPTVGGY